MRLQNLCLDDRANHKYEWTVPAPLSTSVPVTYRQGRPIVFRYWFVFYCMYFPCIFISFRSFVIKFAQFSNFLFKYSGEPTCCGETLDPNGAQANWNLINIFIKRNKQKKPITGSMRWTIVITIWCNKSNELRWANNPVREFTGRHNP